MKTIQLNRMELRNFKGVAQADYDFTAQTNISGGNATGKSTIYEAYLWCLFDKNQQGSTPKVQPLDENNEPKHKLVTSVCLHLTIDGNPLIVERSLQEKWVKPNGKTELVLQGNTSEYKINEVPLSKTAYNAKLAEILPLDKWFTISSINIVPAMEQKAARAALQSIAPAIDERQLAEPFPAVLDALDKNISLDELTAMTRQTKQRAKAELDGIPAALEAQDRLRVDEDFDRMEGELNATNDDIAKKQAAMERLQHSTSEYICTEADEIAAEYQDLAYAVAQYEIGAHDQERNKRTELQNIINRCAGEVSQIQQQVAADRRMAETYAADIDRYKTKIGQLRELWKATNAEQYTEPELQTVCPTCGQPLPESKIEAARAKAREQWNTAKTARLQQLQDEATQIKARIDQLLQEQAKYTANDYSQRLTYLQGRIEELTEQQKQIPDSETQLEKDGEYKALRQKKAEMEAKIAALKAKTAETDKDINDKVNALKSEINALTADRDTLVKRLAARDTNARIDQERSRLETRQRDLADTIAQAEGTEAQITAYRKTKITAVENSVSSLFSMVEWKMYEQNLTNDGEKEICQAIIHGVPYEQQNRATQINAGIDICNAFAKAYGVAAPLFIDNAESVTNTLPTNGQSIKMTVIANQELKIN